MLRKRKCRRQAIWKIRRTKKSKRNKRNNNSNRGDEEAAAEIEDAAEEIADEMAADAAPAEA